MSSMLYEIIELEDGEIVLQRADDEDKDAQPLVTIRFSDESLTYIKDGKYAVAKAMIEAGIEMVGELAEEAAEDAGDEQDSSTQIERTTRTLH